MSTRSVVRQPVATAVAGALLVLGVAGTAYATSYADAHSGPQQHSSSARR